MESVKLGGVKELLGQGINISEATLTDLQRLMPKILGHQIDNGITWYPSVRSRVFSLTSAPDLIFKIAIFGRDSLKGSLTPKEATEQRFANMLKGKEVCLKHPLPLIEIPNAKLIVVDETSIIAEQRFNIRQNSSAQEQLYRESTGLDETIRQIVIFMANTDLDDAEYRNMPILDSAPEFMGNRRVVMVDLEHMEGAKKGVSALINCMCSERQIDIVIAEAKRHGIVPERITEIKAERMEQIELDQQLQESYASKGILENPRQPILVEDLDSLDLDLEEKVTRYQQDADGKLQQERVEVAFKQVVEETIAEINDGIRNTPDEASPKGKRYIHLQRHPEHIDTSVLSRYGHDGPCKKEWVKHTIDALVAKGYLFRLVEENGHGLFVQA